MNHHVRSWKLWGLVLGFGGLCAAGGVVAMRGCTAGSGRENGPRAARRAREKTHPAVVVLTYYPGMPAFEIEKTITNRIERWVRQPAGVIRVTSRSLPGISIVRVYFRDDTDLNEALETTGKLAWGALPALPPDTLPSVVLPFDTTRSPPLGMLVVSSPTASEETLRDVGRIQVRNMLGAIPGCVAPVAVGGKDRTILVYLKPAEMKTRHLSAADVVAAIKKGNMMVTPGIAYFGDNQLLLDSNMMPDKIKELMDLPIRSEPVAVRLRDVSVIKDNTSLPTERFRINGHRAVAVPIFPQRGADPETVADQVRGHLPFMAQHVSRDVTLQWIPFGIEGDPSQPDDDGLLTIHVRAPSQFSLDESEKRVTAIERFLEQNIPAKERVAILSEVGMQPDWWATYNENAGPQDATIHVQLSRDRTLSAAAYASKLRRLIHNDAAFADLGIRFASQDMPEPVDVRIEGGRLDDRMRMAREIRRRLAAVRGTADVEVAQRVDAPYLVVRVDQAKATQVGLSSKDIMDQARAAVKFAVGLEPDPWADAAHNEFYFRLSDFIARDRQIIDELRNVDIRGTKVDLPIKLTSLATFRRITAPAEINHVHLERVIDVRANIEGRDRRDVIADVQAMLKDLHVLNGVRVKLATGRHP